MEKTKKIEIQDLERKLYFEIRLFKAMEGLDFMDKFAGLFKNDKITIKPYLADLLPLATQIDESGTKIQNLNIDIACILFENPIAIAELGLKILEFQEVFLQNSVTFRFLAEEVKKLRTKITE
ncbi:MAG: hypothetical protein LBG48_03720 [Rickettsiales bacterium]|jgi:hypothetical protein|nr:hypothetical protein [Rickettsiales bacterium]